MRVRRVATTTLAASVAGVSTAADLRPMPDPRLPDRSRAATVPAPPVRPVDPTPRSVRSRRAAGAAVVAAVAVGLGFAAVSASPVAAQVDPEPTTTAVPTTVAPTTLAPTTVPPTTFAPSVPPTTFATTQAPVVTTAAPTTVSTSSVITQPTSTASTVASSTTASTTSTSSTDGVLVDVSETIEAEPVVESEGITSTTKLRLVVAALVTIAVVVAVLTFLYWRKTRPYEWEEWEDDADEPDAGPPPTVAPVARTAVIPAVGEPDPAPAAATVAPVVPSLIDPALRARVETPTPITRAAAADETQAMPAVVLTDDVPAPAGADGAVDPAAGSTRWGTERAQPGPASNGGGNDPDAPFRPPAP